MKTTPKDIVRDFYSSDILKDLSLIEKYFHPDFSMIWTGSSGNSYMNFKELQDFYKEIQKSYLDLQIEISHLLQDDDHVTIRYKYTANTIENPDEDLEIAYFMAIWEIKDGKIFKGYQISQPVQESARSNSNSRSVGI